jgi:LEA14-like dessication related protein
MKKSAAGFLFSFSFSIVVFISCRTPKDIEYRDFKNLSVSQMGFSNSSVKMDVIYYNPNNFGLQLKNIELDIYIDGNYLGHTSQEFQISIPKRAEFQIPLEVSVDMKNLLSNGLSTLFNKEVTVKATGRVKVGKANIFMNMPVNYEGKQSFSL